MAHLEKAMEIAFKFHKGQKDKGGNPYILHPIAVMMAVKTIKEKIVAILHDIVEDTKVTLEYLRKEGFDEEIVLAVDALTRRNEETYDEFLYRIKQNELATRVKIEDIKQNMDLTRIPNPNKNDISRVKKYRRALEILTTENYEFIKEDFNKSNWRLIEK